MFYDKGIAHLLVLTLTTFPMATLLVERFAPQLNVQVYYPTRGVASGEVQSVSNGTLIILTDSPSPYIPQGTKVDFALAPETMIFAEGKQGRSAISDIHNYRRATVQYDRNGSSKVAVHIRLFQPIQAAEAQAPLASHGAAAHDRAGAAAHYNRASTLFANGDLDGAIGEFRTAIRLDPNDADAHNALANALDAKGDLDGAIAEFRSAIRLSPKDATPRYNLGLTLKKKGDVNGAMGEYRAACSLEPKNTKYCEAAKGKMR